MGGRSFGRRMLRDRMARFDRSVETAVALGISCVLVSLVAAGACDGAVSSVRQAAWSASHLSVFRTVVICLLALILSFTARV